MQLFIKNYQGKKQTTIATNDVLSTMMKGMMDKMSTIKMTGNNDSNFVILMIPHHEMAVKMAEAELVNGKEGGLKRMAEQMIADQYREIIEFKTWLFNQ